VTKPRRDAGQRAGPSGWRVLRLHHVAFAHAGGDAAGLLGDLLGLGCAHEENGDGFTERMLPAGDSYLQLLQVTGPGTVERFVARRGPGLHHVAFEVDDVARAVSDLRGRGVRFVDETPRTGGMGTTIAFIHPAATGGLLVELVELPRPGPPGAGVRQAGKAER
jgi:methylmalonyl-CoA/ethylmalonyl-CoA epimerase